MVNINITIATNVLFDKKIDGGTIDAITAFFKNCVKRKRKRWGKKSLQEKKNYDAGDISVLFKVPHT